MHIYTNAYLNKLVYVCTVYVYTYIIHIYILGYGN